MTSPARARFYACLVISILACDRTEPTGLPATGTSSLSNVPASVYAEERPFWSLAQTVPGSAGFFMDTASGNVVVSLTDLRRPEAAPAALRSRLAGALAKVRARHPNADVVSRRVEYAFLQLKEWRDRLNGEVFAIPGVVWLDLDEVRNRVVVGLEPAADAGAIHRLAAELAVPEAAVDFETDGPVVREAALTDQVRPIAGGTKIQSRPAGTTVTCTLGFPALWNGTKSFVTASHCSRTTFAVDGTQQYQPAVPLTHADSLTMTPIGSEVADYSEPCPTKVGTVCAWADASIYQFTGPGAQWVPGRIARPTYGCFPGPCNPVNLQIGGYFSIAGTDSSLVVGDLVSMIGSATGWSQAYVQKTCANVKVGTGPVAQCQDYANYGNGTGDSGGPILLNISPSDSNVVLGGIHWGKTGQYSVFSPWSGIAREYPGLVIKVPNTVPANAPDTVPAGYYAPQNLVNNSARFPFPFYRDVVALLFDPSATTEQRQAAVDSVTGTVVGGVRLDDVDGFYLVRLPSDSQNNRPLDAAAKLAGLPRVQLAMLDFVLKQPVAYLRPNDGAGWQRSDWAVLPDSAYNRLAANWAPEAVAAPLAWGCDTGSSQTSVAVIDMGLHDVPDLHANIASSTGVVAIATDSFDHGTSVSGVIGAVGNNQIGVTGLMWHAGLRLWDVATRNANGTPVLDSAGNHNVNITLLTQAVTAAANSGARVINLSLYVPQVTPVADTSGFAHAVAWFDSAFTSALAHAPGHTPLIVVAAGNNGAIATASDAYWALIPTIKNVLPNQTLVVAAGGRIRNSLATFSSNGSLIDVAAPGDDVTVLRATGTGIARVNGTSFSAPLVSGLAGLLFSFDSTLTMQQVRQYIIDGAVRGHFMAGQYHLINAYESMSLAAQRPGAPLCGTRVWANGTTIYAQRDTTSTTGEPLFNAGATASYVNVFHGGRRIEVFDNDFFTHAFRYVRTGTWQGTTDTAVTPPGGTFWSFLWWSHDQDSVVDIIQASGQGGVTLDVGFRTGTAQRRSVRSIPVSLATADTTCTDLQPAWTDSSTSPPSFHPAECHHAVPNGTTEGLNWSTAFGQTGGQIFVTVSKFRTTIQSMSGYSPCPGDPDPNSPHAEVCREVSWLTSTEATDVWSVRTDSSSARLLWSFPSPKEVFWLASSEDGSQVVTAEGQSQTTSRLTLSQQLVADPPTFSGCGVGYRRTNTGAEATPLIPTDAVCLGGSQGQGTIAPAPPRRQP